MISKEKCFSPHNHHFSTRSSSEVLAPFEASTGLKAKIEMEEFDDMCAPNYVIDDGFEILEETQNPLTDLADDLLEAYDEDSNDFFTMS
ncbi:hypothetical protein GCK32_006832 [Trichostrongylus colubriformis]|uniref:Uncharacterized protein n=1 Tax=Trichostrongylus colubriformis TaxID=6319 RepID=A0AAN8FWS8_TRICO